MANVDNVDNATVGQHVTKTSPSGSDAGSRKSSSIEYRSSSAEIIAEVKNTDKNDAKRRSRSPRRSRRIYFDHRNESRRRVDFRRNRPYNRFRNNNRRGDRRDGYNRNRPPYYPRDGYRNQERDNRRYDSKEDKKENQTDKVQVVLKPSDIKNNAKQSAKSFLDMLEEKKRNEAFPKLIVAPEVKKTIPVKIHTFVNTFNSLNSDNTENTNSIKTTDSKVDDATANKQESRDEEDSNFSHESSNKSNKSLNSSPEEGEIRSDSEKRKRKKKKLKKTQANSELVKADNKQTKKSQKNKNTKSAKLKRKRKKRHSSSSSDSSESSDSSDDSESSDSSIESSDSDSSDSDSDSSSESSSSSSESSDSSDHRKKKKNNKKRIKNISSKKHKTKKRASKKKNKKFKKCSEIEEYSDSFEETKPSTPKEGNLNVWPKDIILYTKSEPTIPYSINPEYENDFSDLFLSKSDKSDLNSEKGKCKNDIEMTSPSGENDQSINQRESQPQRVYFIGDTEGSEDLFKISAKNYSDIKMNMNNDYSYYYQYYSANAFPYLEPNDQHMAASYNAYYQMFNSPDYNSQQLASWAAQQGFNLLETNRFDHIIDEDKTNSDINCKIDLGKNGIKELNNNLNEIKKENSEELPNKKVENSGQKINVITTNHISSSISSDFIIQPREYDLNGDLFYDNESDLPPMSPPPQRPKMTVLEATESVKLPNGVILPPGTKQIIVHPYNRPIY